MQANKRKLDDDLPVMDPDPDKRPRYRSKLPTRAEWGRDRIAASIAHWRGLVGEWLALSRDYSDREDLELFADDDGSDDNTLGSHPAEAVDRFEIELKDLGYTVVRTAAQMTLPVAQLLQQ